jgi:hypothetical protein
MTNQEAFDRVVRHLLKQGRKAADSDGVCRYRGPDGTSCAVGCLIPDEEYSPLMEGKAVDSASMRQRMPPSLVDLNERLLLSLQRVHDQKSPGNWLGELERVAEQFGLTMPEVESP